MQQNIQTYIKEIESRKNKIKSLNANIREITDLLEMEKSPYKKEIAKNKEEIELIKKAKINTSFKAIKHELAEKWKVSEDELFISYKTSADFKSFSEQYASIKADKINTANSNNTSDIEITFTISTMPLNIKDQKSVSFTSKMNYQATQMDNEPLYKHLTAKSMTSSSVPHVITMIDNLDQIVVTNRLGDLVYEDFIDGVHSKDFISQVILDASNKPILDTSANKDNGSEYIIELD